MRRLKTVSPRSTRCWQGSNFFNSITDPIMIGSPPSSKQELFSPSKTGKSTRFAEPIPRNIARPQLVRGRSMRSSRRLGQRPPIWIAGRQTSKRDDGWTYRGKGRVGRPAREILPELATLTAGIQREVPSVQTVRSETNRVFSRKLVVQKSLDLVQRRDFWRSGRNLGSSPVTTAGQSSSNSR